MFFKSRQLPIELQTIEVKNIDDFYSYPLLGNSFYSSYHESKISTNNAGHKIEFVFSGTGESKNEAQVGCFMEAIERYSATDLDTMKKLIFECCPEEQNWASFYGYRHDEVKKAILARKLGNVKNYYISAQNWDESKEFNIPAEAVFPWWRRFQSSPASLPESEGSGIASGLNKNKRVAKIAAIREIIERDNCMLSWRLSKWPKVRLDKEILGQSIVEELSKKGLNVHLYDVGDPQLCCVVISLLFDNDNNVTVGSSCKKNQISAAKKALQESLLIRYTAEYHKSDSISQKSQDSLDHIKWGWRNGKKILEWYAETQSNIIRTQNLDSKQLITACRQTYKCEPFFADITSNKFKADGYYVCRAILKNAVKKNYAFNKQQLSSRRFQELSGRSIINTLPHPIG
jgi:YcaO-like protein with predicted kinase domain